MRAFYPISIVTTVAAVWCLVLALMPAAALCRVITKLPGDAHVVALTFDACPTRPPQHFDRVVLDYLIREKLPATLFISGRFAQKNSDEIKKLSRLDFIEIENHSISHNNHMETLGEAEIRKDMDDSVLASLTGKRTKFFRFPAGNYDEKALAIVESRYAVVHWTFASGDPVLRITPEMLVLSVMAQVKPGSILIFHINGKGYSTGAALPKIIDALKKKGYRFVRLEDVLNTSR